MNGVGDVLVIWTKNVERGGCEKPSRNRKAFYTKMQVC